jgi:hypothetical protein
VPDSQSGRIATFFLLFVYHGTHALGKTFATALLAQVSWVGLIALIIVDHVKFQLYKLLRADFIYSMPGVGAPISLLIRFGEQILIDFTSLVHLRHPSECGGAYFLVSSVTSQLSLLICALLYWRYYAPSAAAGDVLGALMNNTQNPSASNLAGIAVSVSAANYTLTQSAGADLDVGKIDTLALFASVGILLAVWAMAVVALSHTIKRQYLRTFWSTQTGFAFSQSFFLDNEGDDAKRIRIFGMNERQWRAIRDRVRQWVLSMYAVWEALKPTWLTDAVRARIPDSFMPADTLRWQNARAPSGRRPTLESIDALP